MAPSAVPFEPSYTALKNLRQKISNYTTTSVTLPHRPENLSTDLHPYLDSAIVTLSTSTAHLYDDNAPWAVRVVEVKKGVERVDTKLDDIKTTFKAQVDEVKAQVDEVDKKVNEVDKKVNEVDKKVDEVDKKVDEVDKKVDEVDKKVNEVDKKVNEVKTDIAEIKTEMKLLENRLESQIDSVRTDVDDVRTAVNNGVATQLNRLRKWLDDPIQPVSALVQIGDRQRYMVAADFPTTVREFWRLLPNKPALIRLANHYSVTGWDRWKRATSGDTDVTCYMELEDAVTAHPDKCLRALAMSWGLQPTDLEQLGEPSRQEGRRRRPFRQEGRLGKRKADTDNGSRRVRAREGQDNDSATGSESASSQDVDNDDKRSQQSISISTDAGTFSSRGKIWRPRRTVDGSCC